jgi:cytochrome c oxidase subunit 2
MYADPENLAETDGKYRGMPNLGLSEDQIDQIVAYLLERK